MKFLFRVLPWLAVCLAASVEAHPGLLRVRTLLDSAGASHVFGANPATKMIVFVFLGPECPISQRYVPELNRIAAQRDTNSVEFYGVVSGHSTPRAEVNSFIHEYRIAFPVLVDDRLELANWLRPTHVPEAYVLKADGDLMYHGRIDDGYEAVGRQRTVVQHRELRDAMAAVLSGRTPPRMFAQPVGCYFEELSK